MHVQMLHAVGVVCDQMPSSVANATVERASSYTAAPSDHSTFTSNALPLARRSSSSSFAVTPPSELQQALALLNDPTIKRALLLISNAETAAAQSGSAVTPAFKSRSQNDIHMLSGSSTATTSSTSSSSSSLSQALWRPTLANGCNALPSLSTPGPASSLSSSMSGAAAAAAAHTSAAAAALMKQLQSQSGNSTPSEYNGMVFAPLLSSSSTTNKERVSPTNSETSTLSNEQEVVGDDDDDDDGGSSVKTGVTYDDDVFNRMEELRKRLRNYTRRHIVSK